MSTSKIYLNDLKCFCIFSIWYKVNIYMASIPNIIWEPLNCQVFLEKVYARFNENGHNISIKIVYA